MDKCMICTGKPETIDSQKERELHGQNQIAEGKVPICATMCSTKALLVGESSKTEEICVHRLESGKYDIKAPSESMKWRIACTGKERL